jgi:GrpB-like predicted nucleotidyltransferase (UPF0157 family)
MAPLVVPHNPEWAAAFAAEARALTGAMGETCTGLHHIGSTAVPGILAKPIIDILGEVSSFELLDGATGCIESLGYTAMGTFGIEGRRYFRKDDAQGHRTHHLHVFEAGSLHIERHLAFRDYLRSHPEKAGEYSALKEALVDSGVPYQDGKGAFVKAAEAEAINWRRSGASGA